MQNKHSVYNLTITHTIVLVKQMDPLDQVGDPSKGQYGVLKIQTSPLGPESASGSADVNGKREIATNK